MDEFCLGNEEALSYFFGLHYKSLFYFAVRLIENKQEAEDITAECFVKAWQRHQDMITGAEDSPYALEKQEIITILSDPRFQLLSVEKDTKELSLWKASPYDYLLKTKLQHHMVRLLESIYQLDVYLAVSEVARTNDFEYAVAQSNTIPVFQTSGLRHPGLRKGVLNPLHFSRQRNLMFLTGANMAGKSTFMKSCGIAVYLAHMGFPVAAREMVFSVCEGLYSSINVSDDLNMGHSHFYAEVLRVKKVAEEVSSGKNLIVLFDELFKGTNVKDAYDGTLAVTAAFSKYRNCFFIVSTHITEVGEALKEHYNNMQMTYLPTVMEGNIPRYTYQLTEGITSDRQGMTIIQNEGILEIIRSVDQHQIKE